MLLITFKEQMQDIQYTKMLAFHSEKKSINLRKPIDKI